MLKERVFRFLSLSRSLPLSDIAYTPHGLLLEFVFGVLPTTTTAATIIYECFDLFGSVSHVILFLFGLLFSRRFFLLFCCFNCFDRRSLNNSYNLSIISTERKVCVSPVCASTTNQKKKAFRKSNQ